MTEAGFTPPKMITQYIPDGFVIDSNYSSTRDVGMFTATNILAKKKNPLPKPFVSPEYAIFELGYTQTTNSALVQQMWNEAYQNAEKESQSQTNPQNEFFEKETIKNGGAIYWYRGVHFNAMGRPEEADRVMFYKARIIKQMNNGILSIKITDFVGDRHSIQKCFQ